MMGIPAKFGTPDLEFSLAPCAKKGRVLLLDGDGLCYQAAHTSAKLDTAIRKVQREVLTKLFLTNAETARVHLTAANNQKAHRGRVKAAQPYQGNRKGKPKPPMLETLREALEARGSIPEADFILHHDVEADDAIIIEAHHYQHNGVVCSADKDLRQTPYPYYESSTDRVDNGVEGGGWVGLVESENTGKSKPTGRGMLFFWMQMLMGDSADNVKGLKLYEGRPVGPVKAASLLEGLTEKDAAELVLQAYGAIKQNAIAEGWLLYLLRGRRDNFSKYLESLELSKESTDLIQEWLQDDWFE